MQAVARRLTLIWSVLLVVSTAVTAHPVFEARLAAVDAAIVENPQDPSLYRKRGNLYLEHSDFAVARTDYRSALERGLPAAEFDQAMGRLEVAAGRFALGEWYLSRALEQQPNHPAMLILRARALTELDRPQKALRDLDRVLVLQRRPTPEIYLEWASAATAAGASRRAVLGLDEAILRFGSLTSLETAALEIELSAGDFESAVARVERVRRKTTRTSLWAVRRAEVLDEAGHELEATAAYRDALLEVRQALSRRRTTALVDLERRVLEGLRYRTKRTTEKSANQ